MTSYLFIGGPVHGQTMAVDRTPVDIQSPMADAFGVGMMAGYARGEVLPDQPVPYRTTRYRVVIVWGRSFLAAGTMADWEAIDALRSLLLELWGKGKLGVPSDRE